MENQDRIEIEPKNAQPKGFQAVIFVMIILLGISSFFFGGFLLVILGILGLFVIPNKIRRDQPISYVLTTNKLYFYTYGKKEGWSIPWEDIEGISIISSHWSAPKSIGIKLKKYTNYQESLNRSTTGNLLKPLNKIFTNTTVMRIGRMKFKCDILIPYQQIDRPAKDFAYLLYSYL